MTVLVTGASGFLGRHLVVALKRDGHSVIAPTRAEADLSNPDAVRALLDQAEPSTIIHAAATVGFGDEPLSSFHAVNTAACSIMAEFAARHGSHMVLASGTLVHGPGHTSYGPDTPIAPKIGYAVSKRQAEEAVIASGCAASIIRFCGIFGADGPDHLGINRAIRGAAQGIVPTVFGGGTALRNYVSVVDAVRHTRTCIERKLQGVYYSSGEHQTIAGMLDAIAGAFSLGTATRVAGDEASDQVAWLSPEFGAPTPFARGIRA